MSFAAPRARALLARAVAIAVAAFGSSALAAEVVYSVSARGNLRERTPTGQSFIPSGDVELLPIGEAGILGPGGQAVIRYNPTLLLRQPSSYGTATFLNRGRVALLKRWERVTASISQDGAYGMMEVTPLRPFEGDLPGAVPTVPSTVTAASVPYERSGSMASLEMFPNDRVLFGVSGGYVISGSPDINAGMPLQQGPVASVRFSWVASRLDRLITTAQLSESSYVTGSRDPAKSVQDLETACMAACVLANPNDPGICITSPCTQEEAVVQATQGWSRQLTRSLNATFSAGAAGVRQYVRQRPSAEKPTNLSLHTGVLPVAIANLSFHHTRAPIIVSATVYLAPYTDRFTGQVYERVEGRLTGEWRTTRDVTLYGTAAGAWAVPLGFNAQAGDLVAGAEGTATWWMTPAFGGGLGLQAAWIKQPRIGMEWVQFMLTVSMLVRDQGKTAW